MVLTIDPDAVRSLGHDLQELGVNLFDGSFAGSPDTGPLHHETNRALGDLAHSCRDIGASIQRFEPILVRFLDDLIARDGDAADLLSEIQIEGITCNPPPTYGLLPMCPSPPTLPLAPGAEPVPPPSLAAPGLSRRGHE